MDKRNAFANLLVRIDHQCLDVVQRRAMLGNAQPQRRRRGSAASGSDVSRAHAHREGAGRDFEIERAAIARGQRIENPRAWTLMTRVNTSRRPVELWDRPRHSLLDG